MAGELFEIGEEVLEAGEMLAEEGVALGEGAVVEEMPEVIEMSEAPVLENSEASKSAIRDFIENKPAGKKLWAFSSWLGENAPVAAKFVGKNVAIASVFFAVTYALNKLIASNTKSTGKRMPLSEYLQKSEKNYKEKLELDWSKEIKQQAANYALGFPWIDATQ